MNNISVEELKSITPRIVLYVGLAYVTCLGIKTAVNGAARLLGLKAEKTCC